MLKHFLFKSIFFFLSVINKYLKAFKKRPSSPKKTNSLFSSKTTKSSQTCYIRHNHKTSLRKHYLPTKSDNNSLWVWIRTVPIFFYMNLFHSEFHYYRCSCWYAYLPTSALRLSSIDPILTRSQTCYIRHDYKTSRWNYYLPTKPDNNSLWVGIRSVALTMFGLDSPVGRKRRECKSRSIWHRTSASSDLGPPADLNDYYFFKIITA